MPLPVMLPFETYAERPQCWMRARTVPCGCGDGLVLYDECKPERLLWVRFPAMGIALSDVGVERYFHTDMVDAELGVPIGFFAHQIELMPDVAVDVALRRVHVLAPA